MTYQPKGGMCATCIHQLRDCSHLPFHTMKPISKSTDLGYVIVRCTDFVKAQDQINENEMDKDQKQAVAI